MIPIETSGTGVSFRVKVRPRGKRNAITGVLGDSLKLSLTSPPVDGRANAACIEFFAELLRVPRSSVSIVAGENNRNKVIRVTNCSAALVRGVLETHLS